MDWKSLLSFNLADGAACSVAAAALFHTLRRDWRDARAQDLARLRLETRWVEEDEALLVTVAYRPRETHTRFAVRLRVLEPRAARLALPVLRKRSRKATLPGSSVIFSTVEQLGWPEGEPGSRELHAALTQWRKEWIELAVMLNAGSGQRKARVRVEVRDQATGRPIVKRTFPAMG